MGAVRDINLFWFRSALASRYAREPLIILIAYIPYFFARGHAVRDTASAFENARRVMRVEENIGIFWELSVQSTTISLDILIHVFNVIYFYGHWPVIISIGLYLFLKQPRVYVITRNAFLLSGLVALLLYTSFPVAPPRLSAEGIVDTLALTVPISYDQSRFVNPYAALPSLHVGWDVLIALGLMHATQRLLWRAFAICLPPAMLLATVITGNHFFLDGVAGAMLAVVTFLVASWLYVHWPDLQRRALVSLRHPPGS
jgi:membrane-associated phospholipid phosphatase